MSAILLRPIALLVVVLTFLAVSGTAFAASPLIPSAQAELCCFSSGSSEELPQEGCTTPDCLCLFCLNLHLTRYTDVSFRPFSSAGPLPRLLFYAPAAFVPPIDYPPERA